MDKLDRLDTGLSSPKTQHPLQETLLKGPKPIELIKSFEQISLTTQRTLQETLLRKLNKQKTTNHIQQTNTIVKHHLKFYFS